ncbi:lactonase family protein [Streptomyces fradiae]|uniref:lactonase family protein n=1 Tax=Streptomyces fradiae TaxID=1906 RepID=UPI002943EBF9|nr:lactonase family protein [Streptomyces fradiae]WOI61017.1 lactonase family protein [Streptomyces fradiae]
MVHQSGAWAYVGSFTSGGGQGITVASVDPGSGALTPVSAVGGLVNPSWLTLDRAAGVLYAVGEAEFGEVAAFRARGPELTPLGRPVAVGGSGPTHLSVAGRRLLTANYGSGSVSSLPLGDDGGIAGPPAVLPHEGSGPDPERQGAPHAHQVLPDPSGRWVLTTDLGTDSVRVCALDERSGAVRVHGEAGLRAGSGPRHLAFHPDGTVVYVLHELEPLVTVCGWDAGPGRLEPLTEVAVADGGAPEGARPCPSVPAVSPDGRFLWVAVRGVDALVTLSLADGPEKPRVAGSTGCGGVWPRDLVVDRAGRGLYVANEWSGDVTWFDADPLDGAPRRRGAVEVPAAACVVLA